MGLLEKYGLYSKETGKKIYNVIPQSRFNAINGIVGTYAGGQEIYLLDFELEELIRSQNLEVGPIDREKEEVK